MRLFPVRMLLLGQMGLGRLVFNRARRVVARERFYLFGLIKNFSPVARLP